MERVAEEEVVVAAMTAGRRWRWDAAVVVAQFFSAFCVLWIWARQMASRYIRQGAALKMCVHPGRRQPTRVRGQG